MQLAAGSWRLAAGDLLFVDYFEIYSS